MAKERIVTLLSDFGTRDGYVASMKGVLLRARPGLTLVDITHEIPHGNVLAAAFVLNQAVDYFPPGTIHLAVVDPGVGTERRILAASYDRQIIIAPDNGLVSFVNERLPLEAIVSVRNEEYFLPSRVGVTFDGRDIMAPVAAALAGGVDLNRFGPPPDTYKLLELPEPKWDGQSLYGQVLYVDTFGNCVTNVSRADLHATVRRLDGLEVSAQGTSLGPLRAAYAHVPAGQALALLNSLDMVEVAVNEGSARNLLKLQVGSPVCIRLGPAKALASSPQL